MKRIENRFNNDYCVASTKADDECQQLNEFLLTADATAWRGSMQDFIAYFKDKVKDYNEKSDVTFKPEQVKAFVEKAARGVPDLAIIKTQARQLAKLGHTVSLPQYYELLEDAAMAYDLTHGRASSTQPRRSRRHVYEHAQLSEPYTVENHDVFHDYDDNNDPFDIDTPLYLVQAGIQRPSRPRLPRDTWFALKPHDQQTWDKITDEGKATIITRNTSPSMQNTSSSNSPNKGKPPGSSLRKPFMRNVQQMDVTELPLEDMTPLQIFYAGREVGMKVGMKTFEANQVETDAYQDEYGSSGDTQHDETHDNDQLYALLTKSNESSKYYKASNPNQGN